MALKMIRKHNRFRVEGQEISLDWLADTRANQPQGCFSFSAAAVYQLTHQQLAPVVNSSNRQAASNHLELFRACGGWLYPISEPQAKG